MELSQNITTKVFVGCQITSELRMHLHKSKEWKQILIAPLEAREIKMEEIHFQGKDFLGQYLPFDTIKIQEIQKIQATIRSFLKKVCPTYQADSSKVYVMPQVFIA